MGLDKSWPKPSHRTVIAQQASGFSDNATTINRQDKWNLTYWSLKKPEHLKLAVIGIVCSQLTYIEKNNILWEQESYCYKKRDIFNFDSSNWNHNTGMPPWGEMLMTQMSKK